MKFVYRSFGIVERQEEGVIRWSHLSPDCVNPGADGILLALASLNKTEPSKKSEVSRRWQQQKPSPENRQYTRQGWKLPRRDRL